MIHWVNQIQIRLLAFGFSIIIIKCELEKYMEKFHQNIYYCSSLKFPDSVLDLRLIFTEHVFYQQLWE